MKKKSISIQDVINYTKLIKKKGYLKRHKPSKLDPYDDIIFEMLKLGRTNQEILNRLILSNSKFRRVAGSTISRYIGKHYANIRQG